MTAVFSGMRFPRSMLASAANERLLVALGVTIIDDCDAELADYARAWVATAKHGDVDSAARIRRVREALKRHDERRAA